MVEVWVLFSVLDVLLDVLVGDLSPVGLLHLEVLKEIIEELLLVHVSISVLVETLDVVFDELMADQLLLAENVYKLLHVD